MFPSITIFALDTFVYLSTVLMWFMEQLVITINNKFTNTFLVCPWRLRQIVSISEMSFEDSGLQNEGSYDQTEGKFSELETIWKGRKWASLENELKTVLSLHLLRSFPIRTTSLSIEERYITECWNWLLLFLKEF